MRENFANLNATLPPLRSALESCQFESFWNIYNGCTVVKGVPGLADEVRKFIGSVISITYQQVKLSLVKATMNFASDEDMSIFFENNGWKPDGESVVIPVNEENTHKTIKFHETVSFSQIAPIFDSLN